MQKPNLDRLWQIKICLEVPTSRQDFFKEAVRRMKSQVTQLVSVLEKEDKLIDWYYFLIHKEQNENQPYFDVVVSLKIGITEEVLKNCLRRLTYCSTPKKLPHSFGETISKITRAPLRNDDIGEAWKLVGEQSEWVINLVNAYKDDALTIEQFTQFMHFFTNPVGLGMISLMTIGEVYQF
jgi:hypothetical protein